MKKRILVLMVGFLFVGINGFAADGDVVINGTLTVQGIKITHVTGTNPTCPSGTGGILIRKWAAKTCSVPGYGGCTTAVGWGVDPIACQYVVCFEGNCVTFSCTADTWTEAVCMGN